MKQPNSTARTCTTATTGSAKTSARIGSADPGSISSASRPPRMLPPTE
jgi:hypothetical protein